MDQNPKLREFGEFVRRGREQICSKHGRGFNYTKFASLLDQSPARVSQIINPTRSSARVNPEEVRSIIALFVAEGVPETSTLENCIIWAGLAGVELGEKFIDELLAAVCKASSSFRIAFERSVLGHRARLAGATLPSERQLAEQYAIHLSKKLAASTAIHLELPLYDGPPSQRGVEEEDQLATELVDLCRKIRSREWSTVLIYGFAQSGKTSLIRALASELLQTSSEGAPIPIPVMLQGYAGEQGVLEYAIHWAAEWVGDQVQQLGLVLGKMVKKGAAILLLDGYDLLAAETRRRVSEQLGALAPRSCVITTRSLVPQLGEAKPMVLHLGRLDPDQVHVCITREHLGERERLEGVLSLLARDSIIADLAGHPWFLHRLCEFTLGRCSLQLTVDLLRDFVDDRMRNLEQLGHIVADAADVRRASRAVARWACGESGEPVRWSFSRDDVLKAIQQAGFSDEHSRQLLEACGASGLMHALRDGEAWFFPVRWTQVYLAAEWIAENAPASRIPYLALGHWKLAELIQFAVPILQTRGKHALAFEVPKTIASADHLIDLDWLVVGRCLTALGPYLSPEGKDLKSRVVKALANLLRTTESAQLSYAIANILGELEGDVVAHSERLILENPDVDASRRQRAAWNLALSQHREAANILLGVILDLATKKHSRNSETDYQLLDTCLTALTPLPNTDALQQCVSLLHSDNHQLRAAASRTLILASAKHPLAALSLADLVQREEGVESRRALTDLLRLQPCSSTLALILSNKLEDAIENKDWGQAHRLLRALMSTVTLTDMRPVFSAARSGNPLVDFVAVDVLRTAGGRTATGYLADLVRDPELSIEIRSRAALALRELKASDQAEAVLSVIQDLKEDEVFRRLLAESVLPRITNHTTAHTLESSLERMRESVRKRESELTVAAIITAMGHTRRPEMASIVRQFLTDFRPQVANAAVEALGRLHPEPDDIKRLKSTYSHGNELTRAATARAFGYTGDLALDSLVAFLTDTVEDVRIAAIQSLGKVGTLEAERVLTQHLASLDDFNSHEFSAVVLALITSGGELATRTVLQELAKCEPHSYEWRELQRAVRDISNPASGAAWVEALKSRHLEIQELAIAELLRIGKAEAIPLLMPLLDDTAVGQYVANTLRLYARHTELETLTGYLAEEINTAQGPRLEAAIALAQRCASCQDGIDVLTDALMGIAESGTCGENTRIAALQALRVLTSPMELLNRLSALLRSTTEEKPFRFQVAQALATIGTRQAFDELVAALASETELLTRVIVTPRFLSFIVNTKTERLPRESWAKATALLLDIQLLWKTRWDSREVWLPSGKFVSHEDAVTWIEEHPVRQNRFGAWATLPYSLPAPDVAWETPPPKLRFDGGTIDALLQAHFGKNSAEIESNRP